MHESPRRAAVYRRAGGRLRAVRPTTDQAERLAGGYRALGDSTRGRSRWPCTIVGSCACAISRGSPSARNLVSHHVKVLEAGGLVRAGKGREMTMYTLTDRGHAMLGSLAGELVGED